jgi:hypothetical protein
MYHCLGATREQWRAQVKVDTVSVLRATTRLYRRGKKFRVDLSELGKVMRQNTGAHHVIIQSESPDKYHNRQEASDIKAVIEQSRLKCSVHTVAVDRPLADHIRSLPVDKIVLPAQPSSGPLYPVSCDNDWIRIQELFSMLPFVGPAYSLGTELVLPRPNDDSRPGAAAQLQAQIIECCEGRGGKILFARSDESFGSLSNCDAQGFKRGSFVEASDSISTVAKFLRGERVLFE